ncbi:HAMP domain-containing sensor histidine kinase [Oscillatoria sp. FACHB-1406]|uniref:sensor histidine kinase n=1 Tax=Oscillatoria sp. FACHB-1406 TaxID=2692846 RepID=UPI0016888645|nr:HAMP domain-containing sensor histidine kinase [Oscillatoria sp. FACHB-1406]MBD2577691.1 HAMP domain-containing histidine kinase [Oscillatoria sp. FACHB-1406]
MNETEALKNEIETLREQLKQTQLAYEMAVQVSQFKAGFLARTSHELRSPLNSLIGLHQLIISDLCDSPEEEREFVRQAHQSSLKLVQLMDTIIDVSKAEYGSNQLEFAPVGAGRLLEELQYLTQLQAANRGFKVNCQLPEGELYLLGDGRRLLQALMAIVDTSLAYMEEGEIEISARPEGDRGIIAIEIRSPLMIWSEAADLIEQVAPPTPESVKKELIQAPKAPSPGMNLLLAQTLLEVLQGELQIVALEPEVTRLQCVLPLADAEAIARALPSD